MAWVEKLPSGKYRGMYRDALGRRRSAGTERHKAAALRKAGAAEDKARGVGRWSLAEAGRMPWSEWAAIWWPTRSVEGSTAATDAGRRDKYLAPKWGPVPIGAISRLDVMEWRVELTAEGVGNSTINRVVSLLRASLTAAVKAGYLEVNVLSLLDPLPEPLVEVNALSEADARAIIAQLPTERDRLIVMTLAATGLRWGELAGLHRARVDFENGMIRVVEVFAERAGRMKAYPKSKRARSAPVPDWLLDILRDLPEVDGPCGVEHESGRCPGPLLLTTAHGSVLRNTNWSPVWRQARADAGFPDVRIHDLRKTAASWWLADGVPLAEVRDMLGHLDQSTTDRYAALSGVDLTRAGRATPKLA